MNRLPDLEDLLPADDLADRHTCPVPRAGVYRVGARRSRRLMLDRALRLTVLSGRLWLTTAGDPRDRFPGPGEDLQWPAGADITIEADQPGGALVAIEEIAAGARPSPADRARRLLARLLGRQLARWRERARLRRDLEALEDLSPERLADIGIGGRVGQALWLRRHQLENQHRLDSLRF